MAQSGLSSETKHTEIDLIGRVQPRLIHRWRSVGRIFRSRGISITGHRTSASRRGVAPAMYCAPEHPKIPSREPSSADRDWGTAVCPARPLASAEI
jgi:hypothetical protein